MFRINPMTCGTVIAFLVCTRAALGDRPASAPSRGPKQGSEPVIVALLPAAQVQDREVRLADIATVFGGDKRLRERIAQLDVADPPQGAQALRVSKDQVAYRLQLAGIDTGRARVQGADTVSLTRQTYEVPAEVLAAAARECLIERLSWSPQDVSIQFATRAPGPVRIAASREEVELRAELHSPQIAPGRVRVGVSVCIRGDKRLEVPVLLDLLLHQNIAVATRRIERGQLLTSENVRFERRLVNGLNDYRTESDSPIGMHATRTLQPLQVIAGSQVQAASEQAVVLVKQREPVQLLVEKGGLRVVTSGESLQDGRAGQTVRVRNVDSQRIILGRVIDRSVVQVLY